MSQDKEKRKGGRRQLTESSPPPRKARANHGKSGHTVLRRVYIGVTVLSAIIVAAFVFWQFFSAPPELPDDQDPVAKPTTTVKVDDDGNEVEVEVPGQSKGRKKEVYTFLIVGQDTKGGGNTDTMMMGTYDVPNQVLNVMSLPRDTYVRYNGKNVLLNSVFNRAGGIKHTEKGIKALKDEIGELTGITPDYYVIVQWDAVGELVNAIDGIDFNVPRRMKYSDSTQDLFIDLQPGMQHLNGKKAMQLIRWRHNDDGSGYANGDLGRIQTQQDFIKAVIAKCLKPDVLLPNLNEYIRIFQDNVVTDLTVSNMAYFAKSAVGKLNMNDVSFATLPYKNAGDGAHLLPVGSEIVKLVNEKFNPYTRDIRLTELDLVLKIDLPPRPSATPKVTENPAPDSSAEPSEDPLLPPGETVTPVPGTSAQPVESQDPQPAESRKPQPTPAPTAEPKPTPAPAETQPPAPEPTPAPPENGGDEPILPPGVEG